MKILQLVKDDEILCPYVEDASNFFRRFMGLMYRKELPAHHGLLLTPCNEIHTFGMRFDIDTVYISKDNVVVYIDRAVKPHRVRKPVKNAHKVLELNADVADILGISVGDSLNFEKINS
jgi:hypothetical protein